MAKILVIPPDHMFDSVPMALGMEAAEAAVGPQDRRDLLSQRRNSLASFAEDCMAADGGALAAGLAVEAEAEAGYMVLEALGAIVMDDGLVSRQLLAERGARVFSNDLVSLVEPIGRADALADAEAASFWHLEHVNVAAARQQNLRGNRILVGVLDTGIDAEHPEFAGKTVHFEEFDMNGEPLHRTKPFDRGTHGTHVCGLIAGKQAGVAPEADLAVAAVLTTPTATGFAGYLVQISRGLNWLLTTSFRGADGGPGVDVVNASLGGTGYADYLYAALKTARLAPGTLLVAAIGNSGRKGVDHHGSPGNYDLTIGVGAMDANDSVAEFSDWGTVTQFAGLAKPDLCAPGVAVISAIPGGQYAAKNGTSMASPIVAGTCALLLEKTPAFSGNVPGLMAAVYSLVTPPGIANPRAGRGRLNLTSI